MPASSEVIRSSSTGQVARKGRVLATIGITALLFAGSSASAAWAVTPPVDLGTAAAYSVLGATTVTNTGPTTTSGNVGVSPGSAITGFPPGLASGSMHAADAAALSAQADTLTAYNDASGRTFVSAGQTDLAGLTLTPGAYDTGGVIGLTGDLTLNAQGNPNAVWVFKSLSTLITGSGSHVLLTNGAQACNVFWVVPSSATLGTNSVFVGTIMANQSVSVTTGVDIKGRALALNAAVTLDTDTFTSAACAAPTTSPSASASSSALPNTGGPDQAWLLWVAIAGVVIIAGIALEIAQPRLTKRFRK